MIRGGSGRHSVLGAWNAVTNALVTVTTDKSVNRETMGALLRKIDTLGRKSLVRLVLDNGRYQHCVLVKDLVKSLNIELLLLPS